MSHSARSVQDFLRRDFSTRSHSSHSVYSVEDSDAATIFGGRLTPVTASPVIGGISRASSAALDIFGGPGTPVPSVGGGDAQAWPVVEMFRGQLTPVPSVTGGSSRAPSVVEVVQEPQSAVSAAAESLVCGECSTPIFGEVKLCVSKCPCRASISPLDVNKMLTAPIDWVACTNCWAKVTNLRETCKVAQCDGALLEPDVIHVAEDSGDELSLERDRVRTLKVTR